MSMYTFDRARIDFGVMSFDEHDSAATNLPEVGNV